MIRPAVIIFLGLPGTGKTFLADRLGKELAAMRVSSDRVRGELGLKGDYRPESKQKVYMEMLRRMSSAVKLGNLVVVDGTFSRKDDRELFFQEVELLGVPLCLVQTTASESVIRERVSKPRPDSEANYYVYEQVKAAFEPLTRPVLVVDTGQEVPIKEQLEQIADHCEIQCHG